MEVGELELEKQDLEELDLEEGRGGSGEEASEGEGPLRHG